MNNDIPSIVTVKASNIYTVNIFIDEDIENQIVINTYEEYDLMYAPLFYNEYKQLFYRNYFIGE